MAHKGEFVGDDKANALCPRPRRLMGSSALLRR